MNMMCPVCYATNEDGLLFCVNCSSKLFEIEDYVLEGGLERWRKCRKK